MYVAFHRSKIRRGQAKVGLLGPHFAAANELRPRLRRPGAASDGGDTLEAGHQDAPSVVGSHKDTYVPQATTRNDATNGAQMDNGQPVKAAHYTAGRRGGIAGLGWRGWREARQASCCQMPIQQTVGIVLLARIERARRDDKLRRMLRRRCCGRCLLCNVCMYIHTYLHTYLSVLTYGTLGTR